MIHKRCGAVVIFELQGHDGTSSVIDCLPCMQFNLVHGYAEFRVPTQRHTGPVDLLHRRMISKEMRNSASVLVLSVHADRERLDTTK